jgi:hypothetical protein
MVKEEEVVEYNERSGYSSSKMGGERTTNSTPSVKMGGERTTYTRTPIKDVAKKAFNALTGGSDKDHLDRLKKNMYKEEVEEVGEATSHQAATTMKHIPNPSPALKKAAKDIKPGIAGYRDRADMLKAGGIQEASSKEEEDHDTISYPLSKDSFKDGMKYASGTSGTVHTSKTHHVKETEAGDSSTDANIVYGIHDKATGKIHGVSISAFNKTTPEKVAKATGSSTVNAAHKALAAHHNETTYVGEERDTPGNSTHQCAIHVKHATMGEGRTLTSQHAQPDTEGQISWYAVMFEHGIEKVETKDLEILESEWHNQHPYSKSSKKMGIKPKK